MKCRHLLGFSPAPALQLVLVVVKRAAVQQFAVVQTVVVEVVATVQVAVAQLVEVVAVLAVGVGQAAVAIEPVFVAWESAEQAGVAVSVIARERPS